MTKRSDETGIALVNALVVLAVTSAIVVLMLGSEEAALDDAARGADIAQAEAIALGAEASVIAALRADLDTGPDADHFAEPWAGVLQDDVVLPEGRFSVTVEDLQAKWNVNALLGQGVGAQVFFARLLSALDLDPALGARVHAGLQVTGPVGSLDALAAFGVPDDALERLAPHVGALPEAGTVNLNTADPFLLRVLVNNPGLVSQLVRRRQADGHLDRAALADFGALRPENTGFTSDAWRIAVRADSGTARVRLESVLLRVNDDLRGKAVWLDVRRFLPVEE